MKTLLAMIALCLSITAHAEIKTSDTVDELQAPLGPYYCLTRGGTRVCFPY